MKTWCIGVGLIACFTVRAATAALITPTQAFASTYFQSQQAPVNLINNSGLNTASGNVLTYTHSSHASAFNMWAAGAGQGIADPAPVTANQYIVFNLGANYDLSSAYLWQMMQSPIYGRGIKDFELYASPNAPSASDAANPPATYDLTGFTQILGASTLAIGAGSTTSTQSFALNSATNVRQVYLKINSAWSGAANEIVGLSEVKFEGTLIPPTMFNWTNPAGGSWQTDGNWSTAVAPTANDNATFALNDTYTVTSAANVAVNSMNVSAGDVTLSLGSMALQAATINLSGGKLAVPYYLAGNAAAGQVGGALNFTDGTLKIVGGAYKPSVGTLYSNTPVPLSRIDSWAISGAAGTSATPTLELTGGANASNPSPAAFGSIVFGINGGKGAVRVTDPGSLLTLNQTTLSDANTLYFGLGGAIISGNFVRSEGSVDVSNQALVSGVGNVVIGTDGASGTATVDNATLRSTSGNLIVGWRRFNNDANRESIGTLAISNGGKATGGTVYVGSRGATGVATVDGFGSSLSSPSGLIIGFERYLGPAGAGGNGTLTLTNGATASGGDAFIGLYGGVGVVNVQSGATFSVPTGSILVGDNINAFNPAGQGTMNVTAGGIVNTAALYIGARGGPKGFVTISDANSIVTATAIACVGGDGLGTLDILNGGTFTSVGDLSIGPESGGAFATSGAVTVDGVNSVINANSDLIVGRYAKAGGAPGVGSLTVANGALVKNLGDVEVGFEGGQGAVTVGKSDGSDVATSKLTTTGSMSFGVGGTKGGTLSVHAQGVVEIGGNLRATPGLAPPANSLKINLAGGTIKTGTTSFSDAAYFNWTGGTLWYSGGLGGDSTVGPDENATLTVPTGALLQGSTNLVAQLAVHGTVAPGVDHGVATFNAHDLSIGTPGLAGVQGEFAADIDFSTSAADLLSITGGVDLLSAKLSLSLQHAPTGVLPLPMTFLLIANDASDIVAGMFDEIDLGVYAPSQYSIDYAYNGAALNGVGTGNDVAITFTSIAKVPEPSTLLLTLFAAGGVLMRRRLRQAA